MIHKLKSQRGETLVENLASIVIAALSVALLFSSIMVSVQIDRMAEKADDAYYSALTAAETQTTDDPDDPVYPVKSGKVKIEKVSGTSVEIDISIYGGEGLYSYTHTEEGGSP